MGTDVDEEVQVKRPRPAARTRVQPPRPSSTGPFPSAAVPVAPVLSLSSFRPAGDGSAPSILDNGDTRFVTSGRVAIALALREMKIGPGDSVLIPAYHCASMVEPVLWTGAKAVFYRVNLDTSVNLDDVNAKIDETTKLIMATNYFGFPQNLSAIRALCDSRGLLLLEDCAHSFFGEHAGKPIGGWGDYAIASSMKFFPVYEGGVLASARHSLASIPLHSAGLPFEAKVAFNTFESGFDYQRMGLIKALLWLPVRLKDILWGQLKARKMAPSSQLSPGSSDGGFGFDPAWLDKRSSGFSRLLLGLLPRQRVATLRRTNYQRLSDALGELPGCRPLFPALPDTVYPWVFPLYCDDLARVFPILKSQGVPIIRFGEFLWEGVDASVCANSVDLSCNVLQFPCHQELRDDEIAWMIEKIKAVLTTKSETAP